MVLRVELGAALGPDAVEIDLRGTFCQFGKLLGGQHPRQPVGAVLTGHGSQQIGPVADRDQTDRVDSVGARLLVGGGVVEAELVPGEHRVADLTHHPVGHVLGCQSPGEQVCLGLDQEPPGGVVQVCTVPFGQRVDHLAHCGGKRRAEAEDLLAASRAGSEQRESFIVVQAGQLGAKPRQQGEPTAPATVGVHRDTGRGQGIDVAQHGAREHFQLAGQLVRGHPTSLAQQQHHRDQPIRTHSFIHIKNHDTRCRDLLKGWSCGRR